MLAVKAEYDNGTVRWLQRPPVTRSGCILVIFNEENESPMPNDQLDEKKLWSEFSLDAAMRGMEGEDSPYTENDIKERF